LVFVFLCVDLMAYAVTNTKGWQRKQVYSLISGTTRIIVSPWHRWPFGAVQIDFVVRKRPQSVAHFHDYEHNFNYRLIALNCGLHLEANESGW
jgi:hypothetical protein